MESTHTTRIWLMPVFVACLSITLLTILFSCGGVVNKIKDLWLGFGCAISIPPALRVVFVYSDLLSRKAGFTHLLNLSILRDHGNIWLTLQTQASKVCVRDRAGRRRGKKRHRFQFVCVHFAHSLPFLGSRQKACSSWRNLDISGWVTLKT